jgi:heptosyltransferase-2
VNWVGDTIMALPAVQALRRRQPHAHLAVLARASVLPLWEAHEAPDELLVFPPGAGGVGRAARGVRDGRFDTAYVLPNSFRSALVPFLGRVPERVGARGHCRAAMLTRVVAPSPGRGRHQAYEYMDLMAPEEPDHPLERPRQVVPGEAVNRMQERLAGVAEPRVVLIPGAARGPSKQWPRENYVRVGRELAARHGCGIVVSGTAAERDLCEGVVAGIGSAARSWAGGLSFPEWMALLGGCHLVVCNDSGGMHVAAALGTPLVAVFGLTDPAVTGPLSDRARVVQQGDGVSRDIARDSAAARKSLASVHWERVYGAALELLDA